MNRMLTLTFATTLAIGAALAACAPSDTSAACDEDADCESGECYTDSDPGYCTAECETEGSTEECPTDTVCKRIEGGPARCILICETDDQCPENSDCNSVNGDIDGCEPVR